MYRAAIITTLLLGACNSAPKTDTQASEDMRALRVVSLDYCADQYALKLLEPEQILALSPDARAPFSYMRDAAANMPSVKSQAEDVLVLNPDLIIRSYGGGPNASAFFERAGIPVVQIGYAPTLDAIPDVTRAVAKDLGADDKGQAVINDFQTRLTALRNREGQTDTPSALYMTPGGVTSGTGSLIDAVIIEAGLSNFEALPGWRDIPLERLAYSAPDIVAAGFFDSASQQKHQWSAMRHPVAKDVLSGTPSVPLDGAWLSCGAWYILDAAEALADGALAARSLANGNKAGKASEVTP